MRISVITVNRNNVEGLRRTIDSVASQTVRPFEFIVIDGGSTDGADELLKASGNVVTDWVSEPDNGIYDAMNKGVTRAHGDWCIFMNSGDSFCGPGVMAALDASGASADIICGNALIQETPVRRKTPPADISLDFLFSGSLCHQSALIRRDLLVKTPYDTSLRIVADRKFFLQALILDGCSYGTVAVDIADYDVNGFSALHRFDSEQEWARVLESTVPYRIRVDYGRRQAGALYGDTPYERLFSEIGRRRWRGPVYRLVRGLLLTLAPFVKSARFVRKIH